jgi:uncharacterized protein (TIGR02246 family)
MRIRGLLLGALALSLAAPPARAAGLTAQEAAAVTKVFDDVVRSIQANDWAGWARHWAEDGVFHPAHAPVLKGRKAIEEYGRGFPAIEKVSFSNVQVSGEGNLAYGTSDWALEFKGDVPADHGKQLAVFRRAANGKWEAVAVSVNSDLPLPARPGN